MYLYVELYTCICHQYGLLLLRSYRIILSRCSFYGGHFEFEIRGLEHKIMGSGMAKRIQKFLGHLITH